MSSELSLFNEFNVSAEVPSQAIYDYSKVTPEQADTLQGIYKRILIRNIATAYEDGKDLLEARGIENLPYKEFIESAQATFGWSERTIVDKMNTALRWGDFTATIAVIEDRAMYLLSSKRVPESARQEAKSLLEAGKDVSEELAKQIRDKHKAELAELEAKNKQLQTMFDYYKQDAQQQKELLNARIDDLEQEISETKLIPEDTPETKERLKRLEAELQERTQQRDNLAQIRAKLSKELDEQRDANKARHEQEMYEHRINDRVKKATEEWGKCSVTLLGQLPSPIESQVVTGSNWALIDHAVDMAQRIIDAVAQLKSSKASTFLDSEVTSDAL